MLAHSGGECGRGASRLAQRLQGDPVWEGFVGATGLVLVVWLLAANARIVSAALEWSFGASAVLVIVQTFADQQLQLAILVPAKN